MNDIDLNINFNGFFLIYSIKTKEKVTLVLSSILYQLNPNEYNFLPDICEIYTLIKH
jgi:hypothetical protein